MGYTYAISMTRPHEALGLPQPVGRRLPQGLSGWNLALTVMSILLVGMYIVEVNAAAARSYRLRDAQQNVESLQTDATILQNQYVAQTSLRAIGDKAQVLGFVPADKIEFVNPNKASYAMAK